MDVRAKESEVVMCEQIYYQDDEIVSQISCTDMDGQKVCLCWNSPEQIFSWLMSYLVGKVGKLEREHRLVVEHSMDYFVYVEPINQMPSNVGAQNLLSTDAAERRVRELVVEREGDDLFDGIMEVVRWMDPAELPQGIDDIVRIVTAWLDKVYPVKVFGDSSDPGPVFIAKLRELLAEWRW